MTCKPGVPAALSVGPRFLLSLEGVGHRLARGAPLGEDERGLSAIDMSVAF
ncbi:MAG: hypothetical protein ACETWR_19665 [Anaerolineae bacterium]